MKAKTKIEQLSINDLIKHQLNLSLFLASAVNVKEALQVSLDLSLHTTGMECGLIYLSHGSEKVLNPIVHCGFEDDPIQMISQILIRTAKDRELSQTMFPEAVNSILADTFQSLITLPLYAEEKLLGWIGLASRRSVTLAEPTHVHLKTVSALLGNTICRILRHSEVVSSKEILDSLLQCATGFVVFRLVHDKNSPYELRQTHISPSIKPILGYDPQTWEVADYYENIHPDDKEEVREAYRAALKTHKFEATVRVFNPVKGRYVWIQAISRAVLNDMGEITRVNGLLIDVSEMQNIKTEFKIIEESLEMKERKLDHLNTTLDTLLEKREKDSLVLEQSLVFNIKEMILPDIVKIRHAGLADKQHKLLDTVEMNLNEIASKFIHSLSVQQLGLSPTEMKIAAYVKQGRSTKEIATLLHSSEKTVKNQRLKIRKKLGICSKKINLRTYLASLGHSA